MLMTLALLTALHSPFAPDSVSGVWRLKGDVAGTPLNMVCYLKQDGAALSGNCKGDEAPQFPVTGEVKEGGKITFQHGGDYQGQELTIIYSGEIAKPGEMTGTILVKPFEATGTFTAAPVPPEKK